MITILSFIIFILGTVWGSFTNVLVDRGKRGKSLTGRSKCDFCGYTLKWYDNIPIISFLLLSGKCRKCHKKLSWQYPTVELAVGLMFVLMAWKSGLFDAYLASQIDIKTIIDTAYYLIVGYIFVAIFVWDVKYMIIPDSLVAVGLSFSVAYSLYNYIYAPCSLFNYNCHFTSNFLGALLVSGFFYLMFAMSKGKWIGGGDVKLGFWLGFLVTWQYVYFFMLIAYVVGSIVAVGLLFQKKKKMTSQIAFGPFLILSALVVVIFERDLWLMWQNLLYW